MRACMFLEPIHSSCLICTILPWGSWWPFVGNRSYNWQCCPIGSTRSFYSSSKSTAKLFWRNCWGIFNISSPWWFWKEIRSWHHSGNGKGQHLRKVPIVPSHRNAKNITTMNCVLILPLKQRRGKNGSLLMKGSLTVIKKHRKEKPCYNLLWNCKSGLFFVSHLYADHQISSKHLIGVQ